MRSWHNFDPMVRCSAFPLPPPLFSGGRLITSLCFCPSNSMPGRSRRPSHGSPRSSASRRKALRAIRYTDPRFRLASRNRSHWLVLLRARTTTVLAFGRRTSRSVEGTLLADPFAADACFRLQSYLAFTFNSETVAHFYLEFIWYTFIVLLFLNGIRHLLLPRARHLLPRSYFRVETFLVKHLYLTSTTGGTKSSEPVRLPFLSRRVCARFSDSAQISLIGATGHLGAATSFQVPLRIHGLVVLCYVIASLALLFTPYRFAKPDIYW